MRREEDGRSGPHWRAILEARWRIRLQEVTELSAAYYAATADTRSGIEDEHSRLLLRRAVAARQQLADTEEALGRLAAGGFGRCEQCGALIPEAVLVAAPECRYCAHCAHCAPDAATSVVATGAAGRR